MVLLQKIRSFLSGFMLLQISQQRLEIFRIPGKPQQLQIDLLQELENLLGIGVNQVTDDGEFSIEAVRCVGCCGLAPVMVVGEEVFGKVTKDVLPDVIAQFRNT